ncbi:MAG: ATP-binding cassette domain-containing protein, partial [Hoeflea sp.]|nr:ATP-binding cassette domain-containing protein [Hoeflea sp.]
MALLQTHGLTAHYGDFQALFGVDVALHEGECVAIIGANGAGKSSLLRSLAGVLRQAPEMVVLDDQPIGAFAADDIVALGISMVPEGRRLFPSLSVEENLLIGAYRSRGNGTWDLDAIYALFPMLKERRNAPAHALSGGQ